LDSDKKQVLVFLQTTKYLPKGLYFRTKEKVALKTNPDFYPLKKRLLLIPKHQFSQLWHIVSRLLG
jgi:hypothetical protein